MSPAQASRPRAKPAPVETGHDGPQVKLAGIGFHELAIGLAAALTIQDLVGPRKETSGPVLRVANVSVLRA